MRYLEDFKVGQRFILGEYTFTEHEIVKFASQFDPQPFHLFADHPKTIELGGLMASGWHTTAIFMRLAVASYMEDSAILTSPGVNNVQWIRPVRPKDTVSGEVNVTGIRLSKSKPDRGVLTSEARLWNQKKDDVLSLETKVFLRAHPSQNVTS